MAGGGGRENNADAFLLFLFAISLSSLRPLPAPFKKLLMLYAEHPPQGAQVVERLDGRFEFFFGALTDGWMDLQYTSQRAHPKKSGRVVCC